MMYKTNDMRTRKDRGRITLADGTTEWRYGNYQYVSQTTLGNGDICPERHIISDEAGLWDVDPATVGEFVGFFYGFKVFEGDIIHLKSKEYEEDWGIVTWHENGYYYLDDTFGKRKKDCVKPIGDFFDAICNRTQITVSGNIHDRPESIKDGKVMRTKEVESICLALGWDYNEQTKEYTKALPDGFYAILYRVSDIRFYCKVVNRQNIPCAQEYVRTYKEVEQILEDFE